MSPEARLEDVGSGLAPVTPGWFVVNARDAAWLNNDRFGGVCIFESDDFVLRQRPDLEDVTFDLAGFTLRVFGPGQPNSLYHSESEEQEDFMLLAGECILVIEGEERQLRAWDVVRCPPGVAHTFVGSGEGPCALLAAGNRTEGSVRVSPRDDLALKHGAGADEDTTSFPPGTFGPWKHERPERWDELPWSGG